MKEKYISVSEASKITGYSRQYILKLIKNKYLEAYQLWPKKDSKKGYHGSQWKINLLSIPTFLRK